jgi:hypothetical protein
VAVNDRELVVSVVDLKGGGAIAAAIRAGRAPRATV